MQVRTMALLQFSCQHIPFFPKKFIIDQEREVVIILVHEDELLVARDELWTVLEERWTCGSRSDFSLYFQVSDHLVDPFLVNSAPPLFGPDIFLS